MARRLRRHAPLWQPTTHQKNDKKLCADKPSPRPASDGAPTYVASIERKRSFDRRSANDLLCAIFSSSSTTMVITNMPFYLQNTSEKRFGFQARLSLALAIVALVNINCLGSD